MYEVNARCSREFLKREMPTILIVDLFLHALEPGWRCAPRFEARTIAEICEKGKHDVSHRLRGQIVSERKLLAQTKCKPMGWHAARGVQTFEVEQGAGGAHEHRGIDIDTQAMAAGVRDVNSIPLPRGLEHERRRTAGESVAAPIHLIASVDGEAQRRPSTRLRRNHTCTIVESLTELETRDIEYLH